MALQYGIARDGAQRRAMGERLAHLVRSGGYHISTGFVCTPIILDALTATGHLAAAERLLTQTECPSWLYPVTMGATTILERWDSMLDDGTINPGEMTSFNHYALRAVADWLHRVVAGLAPDGRGYREIQVAPRPLASLDHARASLTTPYGPAEAGWRRGADGAVTVDALVPANTTARVRLPGSAEVITVGSGRHSWTVAEEPESPPGPVLRRLRPRAHRRRPGGVPCRDLCRRGPRPGARARCPQQDPLAAHPHVGGLALSDPSRRLEGDRRRSRLVAEAAGCGALRRRRLSRLQLRSSPAPRARGRTRSARPAHRCRAGARACRPPSSPSCTSAGART